MTTTPAKRGRPPLELDLSRIRHLAGLGLTMEQIADRVGCSRRALFKYAAEDEEVRLALDDGLAEATEKVAGALFRSATEGSSVPAMALWLRCKGGWSPKAGVVPVNVTHSIESGGISNHVAEMAARQSALLDAPWDDEEDIEQAT